MPMYGKGSIGLAGQVPGAENGVDVESCHSDSHLGGRGQRSGAAPGHCERDVTGLNTGNDSLGAIGGIRIAVNNMFRTAFH